MLSEKTRATLAQCEREAAEATPEHNLQVAAFAREVKPLLKSERQREIAEEIACSFEARNTTRRALG